jgi:hypothetical protein
LATSTLASTILNLAREALDQLHKDNFFKLAVGQQADDAGVFAAVVTSEGGHGGHHALADLFDALGNTIAMLRPDGVERFEDDEVEGPLEELSAILQVGVPKDRIVASLFPGIGWEPCKPCYCSF